MSSSQNPQRNYLLLGVAIATILIAGAYSAYVAKPYLFSVSDEPGGPPPPRPPAMATNSEETPPAESMATGPAPGPGAEDSRRPGREEMRQQMRNRMQAELGLSPEQQQAMGKLFEQGPPRGREDFEQRRTQMESILTPEQQTQFRQMMRSGMERRIARHREEAHQMLPADQVKVFDQKLEERMERWRERGGRGFGGPPPGGPPPDGPPPPDAP